MESRLVYMGHVAGRGRYHFDGQTTSWLKVRNADYSQMEGRPEQFGSRRAGAPSRSAKPVLCAELQAA